MPAGSNSLLEEKTVKEYYQDHCSELILEKYPRATRVCSENHNGRDIYEVIKLYPECKSYGSNGISRYLIYYHKQTCECVIYAMSLISALGVFFIEHPDVTYGDIVDHISYGTREVPEHLV